MRDRRVWSSTAAAVVLATSLALAPGSAAAAKPGNHCFTPTGDDLNAVFGTRDAFVAPFCSVVHVGDRWRAVLRVQAAGGDYVFPAGYAPSRVPLDDDFLAKLVSARFVVDPRTARERSYRFKAKELVIQKGGLPDGSRFVRWVTPSLHPLPPGDHTVAEYVTLGADFWDGFGLDPNVNLIPRGESAVGAVAFSVIKRR